MYFYIIYPNALNNTEKIKEIIIDNFELHKNIDIEINNDDINDFFFNNLYKNEPKQHISSKINYLLNNTLNTPFKVKILIVNDNNESFFNDRDTKKNKNIEFVKREIRNKFNPKFQDNNKKIFPLNKGVSHNHVIHSNDLPEEFEIIKNILIKYKKYKIFKIDTYHHKNEYFLNYFIKKYHHIVNDIDSADIILSAGTFIPKTENYSTKKFIFGPHFGKIRINEMKKINNIFNNNIYIQPSEPSVKLWTNELNFSNLQVIPIPFGVDTEKFKPNINIEKTNVILYYKSRDPNEFNLLTKFLNNKNITYKVFSYQDKYNENHFLEYLKTCKYGVVLGRHESQGFAIQEMLSCNLPLLVWGVTLRKQEYPYIKAYVQIKSKVSTVPYWNTECGELFHNYSELENTFNKFIKNIDNYNSRKFILENLSMDKCVEKWNSLLYEIYNN
tara:strand:- start:4679 stop:6007 length:1329 start_codon:yes stop_codon:yes gene_type:complete